MKNNALKNNKTSINPIRSRLFLMILLLSSAIYSQTKAIYVNVNLTTTGDGSMESPYNSLGDAAYIANQNLNIPVTIYAQGTTSDYLYLQFEQRTTTISIDAYGIGLEVNGSAEAPSMAIITSGNQLRLNGIDFKGGNFTSALFVNGQANGGTVAITNCTFDAMSWTTNTAINDTPETWDDYIHPIVITTNGTDTSGITVAGNTFSNIALGYGRLIDHNGTSFSPNLISEGQDDMSNTATNIIIPFSAATATEFYIDNSVDPGPLGYGGDGSKSKPWKYLSAVNFGAIFNDFSTPTPTKIDKDVTVYFNAGTHMLQNSIYMEGITAMSSLTLKPAPDAGGKVILDGSGITGQWESIIACKNCNNVTIQGLQLKNLYCNPSYPLDTRFGIIFTGTGSNINILNNELSEMHWTADIADRMTPAQVNNLGGIQVLGNQSEAITNVIIDSNNIHDITPGWTEALTVNGNVDGFEITNNHLYDIKNIGIVAGGHYDWVLDNPEATVSKEDNYSKNGYIASNIVERCISPVATSSGIYLDGCQNVTVINNTSKNNGVGISIGNEEPGAESGGHTISGNSVSGNLDAGLYIGSTTNTSLVTNVAITENQFFNNYNSDPSLLALTAGNWGGGEKSAEIKMYRIKNLNFSNNEVTSLSDHILLKDYHGLHKGNHTYTGNTYITISNDPALAIFTYGASGGDGLWYAYNFCEHQAQGFDLNATLGGNTVCKSDDDILSILENDTDQALADQPVKFTISPNPAIENITLASSKTNRNIANISIYTLNGKLVVSDTFSFTKEKTIALSNFEKGIYILTVSYGNGQIHTEKFIKQ